KQVAARWPNDVERVRRMSVIEEGPTKQVRMAHLSIVGGHSVNGVADVHSRLVQTELVPDFAELWPERFNNKTNGVTPRRWMLAPTPGLARLLNETIGAGWAADTDRLRRLEEAEGDASLRQKFASVKRDNKRRLAAVIKDAIGEVVDPNSLFDI